MAIFRGLGGSGDATGDAANQAVFALQFAANAELSASSAEAAKVAAEAAQAAAEAAQTAAETAETNAETAETNAETAQTAAETAETNAAASESAAATSEANALASEQAAALSESNASTSEANALASEQAAALSESNASTSEANALASEQAAASSESNATASESKAQQWATEAEDVPVETSPTNLYSAFHWAQKSENFAQTININPTDYVTVANNQTITGVKTFDNGLATDTISEETSAAGVTIDGVLLKDSAVNAPDGGTFTKTTATTDAVTQVLRIDSQSSGTPANGIGVGVEFAAETTAGNTEIGATIEAITTDVTAASEDFDLSFKTMAGGAAAAERMRLTSTGEIKFNSGYGSVATAYGCRAWVNFNGTGTPAIRASGNVTSITDNGTGDYTVNFTTAMPDANYVMISCSTKDVGQTAPRHVLYDGGTKTTSAIRLTVEGGSNVSGIHFDNTDIYIAIFR